MNIKNLIILSFLFILSCGNIELVLNKDQTNQIRNNVSLISVGDESGRFTRELYSYFNNSLDYDYILKTTFVEKKENIIVKKNQVAEKIDYSLEATYELYFKTTECKIFAEKITSTFSFTPKSAGYNFGTDISFEKLYSISALENIERFIDFGPFETTCL